MLYHDYELDRLAYEKSETGCRDELKRKANKIWTFGRIWEVLNIYKFAHESDHLDWRKNLTIVKVGTNVMFFNQELESVRKMIEDMVPKKKRRLPSSVIQKIIVKRIREIHYHVHSMNRLYETQVKATSSPILEQIPRFDSIQSLKDWFENNRGNRYAAHDVVRLEKQFIRYVFSKPEITDDDVKAASDLVCVSELMND